MNLMNKLTTYATLIGVIGAIGGGFYTWGEFNTRLDAIESKKVVSLAPINKQVVELRNTISSMEVDLIDRIDALREKVEAGNEVDLSALTDQIEELASDIKADMDAMKETLTKVDKEVSIAVRLKASNPLAS